MLQPLAVPVTVYVVVLFSAGVVAGLPLRPPVHVYVVAPFAVNVAVWPEHIPGEFTVTFGKGVTVTVAIAVPVQLPEVPVTVYVVVVFNAGVVAGLPLSPPVHVYVVAPPAVNVAVEPAHIAGEFTVTFSDGVTVTVATAVLEQLPVVPVTVYVVVDVKAGVVAGLPLRPPVHV